MLIRTTTPRLIENIVIREAVPEDARSILHTVRNTHNMPECNLNALSELLQPQNQSPSFVQNVNRNPNALILVAEAISLSQTVGTLLCHNPPQPTKRHIVRLGVCVRKEWRGRGLRTRLIQEAIRWAQRHQEIRRIEVEVMTNDANNLAVYAQLGFLVEGRALGSVHINDQYVDSYSMALYVASIS